MSTRVGLYARVSTIEQSPDAQLAALRDYSRARGWTALEFVDHGVSGAKDRRPGLDDLVAAARARRIDVVCCVKLDRLARSVRHLVTLGSEFQALGVELVAVEQQIDSTTPTGRLLFHMLGAIAEFERDLIRDRVLAGVVRAKQNGVRFGRPVVNPVDPVRARAMLDAGATIGAVARAFDVHRSYVARALRAAETRARA